MTIKVFKNGCDKVEMFKPRISGPAPWTLFALSHVFGEPMKGISKLSELKSEIAIGFELMVLLSQPQPNWPLLLKVKHFSCFLNTFL